jgi:hydroxymethylpyrimidine/phosphomethylpyrimidine kinase
MSKELQDDRPAVLVVAGFDQSAGAGVLSDIKTLEVHGVYGYAVCTGFTFQNERMISRIEWFTQKDIFEQIDLCFGSTGFDWVKIGITPSMRAARSIIDHIRQHNSGARIVLDPVIRASSGREFWEGLGQEAMGGMRDEWEEVVARCYVLTPNWEEIGWLYPGENVDERCAALTKRHSTHIYLKGGHHPELPGRDYLWINGERLVLDPAEGCGPVFAKHGSGCVLSSSLAANLALGYPLPAAAVRTKEYIGQFLTSNKTLLGWHRPLKTLT